MNTSCTRQSAPRAASIERRPDGGVAGQDETLAVLLDDEAVSLRPRVVVHLDRGDGDAAAAQRLLIGELLDLDLEPGG
ncbi:MAG: hypothetical protein RML45_01365 [Acetobacteraceae bacterium]|nr:hypothetical protein [Acetobacteraceae bacterium]